MAPNWPLVRVEEFADKVAMGPFGSNIKVETFVDSGVPVISGAHLRGARVEDGSFNFVTPEHAERLKNSNVLRGDVVFTHAGNIGQVAYVPESSRYERYVISQRQFYLRCDRSKADPAFITYFFHSPEGQHKLLVNASQVGVPSISRPSSNLKEIEVALPPLAEQRAIAGFLGSIDDRIDNLRQTNATLEAIAQALFKSWFVDFDPVRAKAEGREPEGMDAATAALFSDEFEDSELGLIPKGWHIKRLGDVCRLTWGNTSMTKKSYVAEGVKAFSAAGQDGFVEVGERNGIGSVISAIGTVGVVHLAFGQWTAIKNTLVAQCDTDVESSWLHHLLKTIRFPARGSTQQFISQTDARNVKVILPPLAVRNEYGETCVALISKMEALQRQVRSLDQLRDTLLPRLISGRISPSEAIVDRLPE